MALISTVQFIWMEFIRSINRLAQTHKYTKKTYTHQIHCTEFIAAYDKQTAPRCAETKVCVALLATDVNAEHTHTHTPNTQCTNNLFRKLFVLDFWFARFRKLHGFSEWHTHFENIKRQEQRRALSQLARRWYEYWIDLCFLLTVRENDNPHTNKTIHPANKEWKSETLAKCKRDMKRRPVDRSIRRC